MNDDDARWAEAAGHRLAWPDPAPYDPVEDLPMRTARRGPSWGTDATKPDVEGMARAWHAASDHGRDGTPYGAPLCNCDRIATRAAALGWSPVSSTTRQDV